MNWFKIVQQIIKDYQILKPIITEMVEIHNKGKKKMDEKLYYEVNVTTSTDIKNAYEYVVVNNIKHYRCIAKDGSIYGWVDGKHIRAAMGQEWFENPEYIEPEIEKQPDISLNESVLEKATTTEIQESDNQILNEDITDYKALYEETKELLKQTQDAAANYLKAYTKTKTELDSIRAAFALLVKEYEIAKEAEG